MSIIAPKVTVLMPVYNTAQHLAEAIDSMLKQSFSDFELLIIDDGSTDDSVAVIRGFEDSRIRLECNHQNLGLIETLNRGLEVARGEYIARMDSDDISHTERLQKQVDFMDEHTCVGVCSTDARGFGRGQDVLFSYPRDHEDIRAGLLFASSMVHAAAMMRKEVIARCGLRYSVSFPHAEDYGFWLEASAVTRFANLRDVLYYYRLHSERVGERHQRTQIESANRVRAEQLERLGVDSSAAAVDLHLRIATADVMNADELMQAGDWLTGLANANTRNPVYEQAALHRTVAEQWLKVCVESSESELDVWRIYRGFPMRRWRRTPMRRHFGIEKRLLSRRFGRALRIAR